MGSRQCNSDRIMADIYGTQNNILFQTGLADAINEHDFMAKSDSLGQIWDYLFPGFQRRFWMKRVPLFIEYAILSARENACIESQFYTNGLELKHRLPKKKLVESNIDKTVDLKNNMLQKWMEEFNRDEIRAVLADICFLKNIKLLLLIPRIRINGGRTAELKGLTYSINTHHLL